MPITVGHDTAKTRKTLTVGDLSVALLFDPGRERGGSGRFLQTARRR